MKMAKSKRKPQKSKKQHKRRTSTPRRSPNARLQELIMKSIDPRKRGAFGTVSGFGEDTQALLREYTMKLLHQYNGQLASRMKGPSDIEKLDVINLTGMYALVPKTEQPEQYVTSMNMDMSKKDEEALENYCRHHDWLSVLPCTPEGVMNIQDVSVYFSFDRLSLEDKQIDLHLTMWSNFAKDEHIYHYDLYVTVDFAVNGSERPLMMFNSKSRDTLQLYNDMRVYQTCRWDAQDRARWSQFLEMPRQMLQAERRLYDALEDKCETDRKELYYEVMKFLNSMAVANAVMAGRNTPPEKSYIPTRDDTAVVMGVDYAPDVIVQKFGGLMVSARHEVSPIRSLPTSVNYTQDQWQVRGHMRTYKNGRTVYIAPHISKRHGMPDASNASQPRKIRELNARGETDE